MFTRHLLRLACVPQHNLERHDEGIASVERAVRLNPSFVNAYLNLAR